MVKNLSGQHKEYYSNYNMANSHVVVEDVVENIVKCKGPASGSRLDSYKVDEKVQFLSGLLGVTMINGYILDRNNEPVKVDFIESIKWKYKNFERCIVEKTMIGAIEVSTVFIHCGIGDPPQVFETMTFGINLNYQQWRCCTWKEAFKQHEHVCDLIKQQVLSQ